jgi:CheY-like chemotaxis protein
MARALNVLLIDDNEDDILLFRLATKSISKDHKVLSVNDARQAMELLQGKSRERSHPLPDLLVVDLKMPGITGFEFLAWLRDQPKLRFLPALVLSGSGLQADIEEAYKLGARGYLTKPFDRDNLVKTLQSMYAFWSECEFLTATPASSETVFHPASVQG